MDARACLAPARKRFVARVAIEMPHRQEISNIELGALGLSVDDESAGVVEVEPGAVDDVVALAFDGFDLGQVDFERTKQHFGRLNAPQRKAAEYEFVDGQIAREHRVASIACQTDRKSRPPRYRNRRDRADVGEIEAALVIDYDFEIVVESNRYKGRGHLTLAKCGDRVLKLKRVRLHDESAAYNGPRNANHVSACGIIEGAVEDLEVMRIGPKMSLDMWQRQLPLDIRHLTVAEVPSHYRVLGDTERAHQRLETSCHVFRRDGS